MSVRQLLASHTSYELAEWEAYDRVYGFGDEKLHEVLAALHEQVQLTNHLLGAAHFGGEDGDDNPIPAPSQYPRGGERPEDSDEE